MKSLDYQKAELYRMRRNAQVFLDLLHGSSGATVGKVHNMSSSHVRFQAEDYSRYVFKLLTLEEYAQYIGTRRYLTMRDFRRDVAFWDKKAREFMKTLPSVEEIEAREPAPSKDYQQIVKRLPRLSERELTLLRAEVLLQRETLRKKEKENAV